MASGRRATRSRSADGLTPTARNLTAPAAGRDDREVAGGWERGVNDVGRRPGRGRRPTYVGAAQP
ncbi:hypothetical protein ACFPM0_02320 [Pseudonocardia sulfidoxydans]|uniref:hypothetical protein n=1 Tax=Pseudonocardia sulfidoxydans TaxID=54011 RepID=UPI0036112F1E